VLIKKATPNNAEALISFLEPYRPQLSDIIMEETENWQMLVGSLAENGFRTQVI